MIESHTNAEIDHLQLNEKPATMFHVEPKTTVQKSTSQENMYEKVIYRFFDETPSMIEETSQEDEESKTYSRVDTVNKLSALAKSG